MAGTGAAQYMSEGHHPIYNPEKRLGEEIKGKEERSEENSEGEKEIFEKEAVCGDGICEGAETYENCPKDCCGENCKFVEDAPEGKDVGKKEVIESKKDKSLFEKIIDFFRKMLGKSI